MENLPNKILIESYRAAKHLNLNPEFISLIEQEILKRNLICKKDKYYLPSALKN